MKLGGSRVTTLAEQKGCRLLYVEAPGGMLSSGVPVIMSADAEVARTAKSASQLRRGIRNLSRGVGMREERGEGEHAGWDLSARPVFNS